MAKVYSWSINNRTYAYIVNPDNTSEAYVGSELKGSKLQTVADWAQNASDTEYDAQFSKMLDLCRTKGYNVEFESSYAYRTVTTTCDNLRGPQGRGIESITYLSEDTVTNSTIYKITYDDGESDTFAVRNGQDGAPGAPGQDGAPGDNGVSSKVIMVYASGRDKDGFLSTPKRPEGGSYDFITNKTEYPDGWKPTDNVVPPVWMSSRTFTSTEASTDKEWSLPVQISGDDGSPGTDGTSIEFIYNRTKNKPNITNMPSENKNGFVPDDKWGFTPSPQGVDEYNPTEWCCIRKMEEDAAGNKKWGAWQGPTIWSQYGVNGQDGDGVQYIYIRNKGNAPLNPTPLNWETDSSYQAKDMEWVPTGDYKNIYNEDIKITEENQWTDNPQGVTSAYMFEWVASRKYRKGDNDEKIWQQFSTPTLWAKFGDDGKHASGIRTLYCLTNSTSDVPTVPSGVTDIGTWGTGFPTAYEYGKNVVWGTVAEIWANDNTFVDPETGWSEPFVVTGTRGADADAIDYNSRAFAYGYVDSTPYKPEINTAEGGYNFDNIPDSTDGKNRTIKWYDFCDTTIGSDNETQRWYQCDGYVDGETKTIIKWGPVLPCNGRDGNTIPGKYTEFRFGISATDEAPALISFDDNGRPIRNPETYITNDDGSTTQVGWFTTSDKFTMPEGGSIWETWATIDGQTEEIIINGDGIAWSTPIRVNGEKGETGATGGIGPVGPRGVTGIPGANLNTMYCLGTESEPFGSDDLSDNPLKDELKERGWFKEPPYSIYLEAESDDVFETYINDDTNVGRVIRRKNVTEKEIGTGDDKTTEIIITYDYYVIKGQGEATPLEYDKPSDETFYTYIWCIQGTEIYEINNDIEPDEDGNKVEYVLVGIEWCTPFRTQGINGLQGIAGNRGQVIYPMGVYNQHEVYITTEDKAPYVLDPNDGLFYVYNIVDKPWVGKLPSDYETIQDKNGNLKYQYNGILIQDDHNGITPSVHYANYIQSGMKPSWIRFETFDALYTSIGIIENGLIGSAVYNNEFMFSQQGINQEGQPTNYAVVSGKDTQYGFLSGYEYDEDGDVYGRHWKYREGTFNGGTFIDNTDVNPYEKRYDEYIHTFMPNVCINFATGQMWTSCGMNHFDYDGSGYLASQNINWNKSGKVYFGPLEDYKNTNEQKLNDIDENIQNLTNSLGEQAEDISELMDSILPNLEQQLDKKVETWYQSEDPSEQSDWVNEEHIGDMWYNTDTHITYRWNGSEWEQQNIPQSVFDAIDGKSSIFITKPENDIDGDGYLYHKNDMWLLDKDYTKGDELGPTGKEGSIWVAKNDNNTDQFKWDDWLKMGTELDNWVQNDLQTILKDATSQADGIVNTHYGPDDPSTGWQDNNQEAVGTYAPYHLGDLWFNTNDNKSYIYASAVTDSSNYQEATPDGYYWVLSDVNIPQSVYDAIDGKCQIFVSEPRTPWYEGDLWLKDGDGNKTASDIYRAISDLDSGVTNSEEFEETGQAYWIKACNYTDDTNALNALKRLNAMGSDGFISPDEQKMLKEEYKVIEKEYNSLVNASKLYGLHEMGSTYYSQYDAYATNYTLAELSFKYYTNPENYYSDVDTDEYYHYIQIPEGCSETGNTGQYYGNIAQYYGAKQDLQNALVGAAEDRMRKNMEDELKKINKKIEEDTQALADEISNYKSAIETQLDGIANTFYGPDDPSTGWTLEVASEHIGDMWFNTNEGHNRTYIYSDKNDVTDSLESDHENYYWIPSDVPASVYDAIDGRSKIFISKPAGPYNIGDLWFTEKEYTDKFHPGEENVTISKGTIMVCLQDNDTYDAKDWGRRDSYADEAMVNAAKQELEDMERTLTMWSSDGLLNPTEIKLLSEEVATIRNEYNSILEQAATARVTGYTQYTNYTNAYYLVDTMSKNYYLNPDKATAYLDDNGVIQTGETITGYVMIINSTSNNYYYGYYLQYYKYRQELLQAISDKLNSSINDVKNQVNSWADDNYITPIEMKEIRQRWNGEDRAYESLTAHTLTKELTDSLQVHLTQYRQFYQLANNAVNYYAPTAKTAVQIITGEASYAGCIRIISTGTGTTANAGTAFGVGAGFFGNIAEYYVKKLNLQNALLTAVNNIATTELKQSLNELVATLGYDDFDSFKEYAQLSGQTLIENGYINTELIETTVIVTKVLAAFDITAQNIEQSGKRWGLLTDGSAYFSSTSGVSEAKISFKNDGSGYIGNPSHPGIEWDSDGTLFINKKCSEGVSIFDLNNPLPNEGYTHYFTTQRQTLIINQTSSEKGFCQLTIALATSGTHETNNLFDKSPGYQGTLRILNNTKDTIIVNCNTSVMSSTSQGISNVIEKFYGMKSNASSEIITTFVIPPLVNCYFDLFTTQSMVLNDVYIKHMGYLYQPFNNYYINVKTENNTQFAGVYPSINAGSKRNLIRDISSGKKTIGTNRGTEKYNFISGITNADRIVLDTKNILSATTVGNIWVCPTESIQISTTTGTISGEVYSLVPNNTSGLTAASIINSGTSAYCKIAAGDYLEFNVREKNGAPLLSEYYYFYAYLATTDASGNTLCQVSQPEFECRLYDGTEFGFYNF